MKNNLKTCVFLLPAICILFLVACKKDENNLPPVITFKTGSQFTSNNSVVMVGHSLHFGIQARGNGVNITNFTIKKILGNNTVITVMDTGMNAMNLDIDKIFYQNVEPVVTWTFTVMDRNRMTSQLSLKVYKDSNSAFGGIYYLPDVKMGYQLNTQFGHFLDISTGKTYFEDSAAMFPDKIDILTYYIVDGTPSPVFSSPGEMDNYSTEAMTYYPSIPHWATRKYTLWDISVDNTPVSAAAFDNAHNDSLLIVGYHEVWGKKKFKWATTGRVIPFITAAGKKGMIKVINAELSESGTIEFALKIQQ